MYEIILGIHIASMVWNIFFVVISDLAGLRWVLGFTERVNMQFLTITHRLIWLGLAVSIFTGAYLFSTASEYLFTVPAFYSKMFFVAALLINAVVIGKHLSLAATQSFAETSGKERTILFVSGAVSTLSWVGVLVSANLLGL